MAKGTGLGDGFFIDGYDLSGDTNSVGRLAGGPAPIEMTGIDKSAFEREGGIFDGEISWVSYFNDAALQEHVALSTLPTVDRIASYRYKSTLGNPAASLVCKQVNYDPTRGQDGSLLINVQALAAAGSPLEWGVQLTAGKRTDTGATNGTGVDLGVGSTSFGLSAYLHVFSFTGTSCTVALQESSDNGAGDAFAAVTGGAFTAATGRTKQRIATSSTQTIERYLRVVTTGTFSECTFWVQVTRNDTAVEA